jgi:hypothetical protein
MLYGKSRYARPAEVVRSGVAAASRAKAVEPQGCQNSYSVMRKSILSLLNSTIKFKKITE